MKSGIIIIDDNLPGEENMRRDLIMFESELICARIYQWSSPVLTVGYAQKLSTSMEQRCNFLEIPVVRRPTGGRAVLHDREITYSVAGNLTDEIRSIGDVYKMIADILRIAMIKIGINVEVQRPARRVERRGRRVNRCNYNDGDSNTGFSCYDAPSDYEIVANGKKLIGSAQKRTADRFLQHGSIPISVNERYREFFPDQGITVEEILKRRVGDEEIKTALSDAFMECWRDGALLRWNDVFRRGITSA